MMIQGKLDVGGFAGSCSTLLISRASYLFICFSFLVQGSGFVGPQPERSLGNLVRWAPVSLLAQMGARGGPGFCVFFLEVLVLTPFFFLMYLKLSLYHRWKSGSGKQNLRPGRGWDWGGDFRDKMLSNE